MTRLIGLDHGAARCGVAMTDPSRTIVTPREPIERPDTDAGFANLVDLIQVSDAEGVIVGLPLGLDGSDTRQTVVARNFAARLRNAISPVWVDLLDERHTTSAAQVIGGSSAEDSRAAAVLLERWLERSPE